METTIPIAVVRERERDPQAAIDAQARIDAVSASVAPHTKRMNALGEQARREPNVFHKFALLRQIAQYIVDAMQGISACSRGCSHCCYTPVMITRLEAGIIACELKDARGRPLPVRNPKAYYLDYKPEHIGKPCPFLDNGRCSIYASRPLACRLQFNMDADDLLCHLFENEEPVKVPYFNKLDYHMLEILTIGPEQVKRCADIREFFPDGLSK